MKNIVHRLNSDDLRVYLGTSGPSVGDVLAVGGLDGNTGLMEWSTPSGGFQSYTNKAGADVINWDYATDGPNTVSYTHLRAHETSGNLV